jgi:catechol 2,3-dioxygenase-like lactoylglutathione lyase family enzyme
MVKCRINGFSSPLREGCVMMRRQGVTHVYDSRVGSALQGAQRVSSPEYERKVDDQQQYTVYIGGEDAMLSNYPIDVVLLATDLAAAKEFYAGKIGLPVRSRDGGWGDVSMWGRQPLSGHEEQRGDQGRADTSGFPRRRRAGRGQRTASARRADRRLRPARTQDPGRHCRYRVRLDGLVHRSCQELRGPDTAQKPIVPFLLQAGR